jgi:diaminobutyrate-2-oxoglutarate transaminase
LDEETLNVFATYESNVRLYGRMFPAVFAKGEGHILFDQAGNKFLDFFSGAGALNYGHNNPAIIRPLINYMEEHGILQSLDLYTAAKAEFITTFQRTILERRGLTYKMQFPGPTGTNAIESALKLARKYTRRSQIIAFSGGFHGMSLGSLAATANSNRRAGAGVSLNNVTFMPYDGYLGDVDTTAYLERMVFGLGSGVDLPAAILVETVQGEGGLQTASPQWLQALQAICRRAGALLIVDDIQAGCGRTGTFFSFEPARIVPDIVCLSKSLSGSGLPMSLMLLRPEIDVWTPGEHSGTFRGNNLGFVGASAAIATYWCGLDFAREINEKSLIMRAELEGIVAALPSCSGRVKGTGMLTGLEFSAEGMAIAISQDLFSRGLIAETCGVHNEVLKLIPPLTIPVPELRRGLALIRDATLSQLLPQRAPDRVAAHLP